MYLRLYSWFFLIPLFLGNYVFSSSNRINKPENFTTIYITIVQDTVTTTLIPSARSFDLRLETNNNHHSVARIWNEAVLEAIRNDYARPTVHARNLFHTSIAMYDAWAIFDTNAKTYLLGNTVKGYTSSFNGFTPTESIEVSRSKVISYAMYRILTSRFRNAPDYADSKAIFDANMSNLGYDISFTSVDYSTGNAAALGNFIAQTILAYGNSDESRESTDYDNAFYDPVNDPLNPTMRGNPTITDPNRWQPLSLDTYIDQSGNLITGDVIDFLSPEWGAVSSFAIKEEKRSVFSKDGNQYTVCHDPGHPPYIDVTADTVDSDNYKWGFSMVAAWQSHLDPTDNVLWDISPGSIGNLTINDLPTNISDYPSFYNYLEGGDNSPGHDLNPKTGLPYNPQIVKRGDYARVLAEFWADGPDSETPPGHWFTLLNYVSDSPSLVKKMGGQGATLSDLEWDVKSYFMLGGAMHDAAITAWGIKGYYDYLRPISAIRYMVDQGQSSDPGQPSYSVSGIPLRDGLVELVKAGDPLAGPSNQHVGKIKLYTWRGPDYISNPDTDDAGVGWILGENWWPYQRPSFVTPPFAGYVSGHSTYSRAAAEVLTLFTGDAYFPGGMGEFVARQNEFLVFEEGPSTDVVLQWATYRDASDQCSLSRIWGGIHPPADDIPGRIMGYAIGHDAYELAVSYFDSSLSVDEQITENFKIYPNPVLNKEIFITKSKFEDKYQLLDVQGRNIPIIEKEFDGSNNTSRLRFPQSLNTGIYILKVNNISKILAVKGN